MPKITFIVDYTPQGHAPDRPTYKGGETYDLHISYAEKYVRLGLAKDFDPVAAKAKAAAAARAKAEQEAADRMAAKLEQRGKVMIPADLSLLEWPGLRELAQSLSDDQIKDRDAALKAINAELARRAGQG